MGLANNSTAVIEAVHAQNPIVALECLADARTVDAVLAQKVIDSSRSQLGTTAGDPAIERAFGAVASDRRERGEVVFTFLAEAVASESDPTRRLAAARALSLTNQQRAAEVLIQHYDTWPDVRAPLVLMGDLAASALQTRAHSGSLHAIDDLGTIGTPRAAQALAALLWHADAHIASRAAWRLGALLVVTTGGTWPRPNLEVETALRGLDLTDAQRRTESLPWVWEPFATGEPAGSALPAVVGRIAFLLSDGVDDLDPVEPVTLDPRLVIPVCAISLRDELPFSSSLGAASLPLVELAMSMFRNLGEKEASGQISVADGALLRSALPSLRYYSSRSTWVYGSGEYSSTPSKGIVLHRVLTNFGSPALAGSALIGETWERFIALFVDEVSASARFKRLLATVPSLVQAEILNSILNTGAPRVEHWRAVTEPESYTFGQSWSYRLILAFATILSLVALWGALAEAQQAPRLWAWSNAFPLVSFVPLVASLWLFVRGGPDGDLRAADPWAFLKYAITGLIRTPLAIIEDLRFELSDPVTLTVRDVFNYVTWLICATWLPLTVYWAVNGMLMVLPWQAVLAILVAVVAVSVPLWMLGARRERLARNPLRRALRVSMVESSGAQPVGRPAGGEQPAEQLALAE